MPLHRLQPWQARFVCRDSDYVLAQRDLGIRDLPVKLMSYNVEMKDILVAIVCIKH